MRQWSFDDSPRCPFYRLRSEPSRGVEILALLWYYGNVWTMILQTTTRTEITVCADAFKPTSYE